MSGNIGRRTPRRTALGRLMAVLLAGALVVLAVLAFALPGSPATVRAVTIDQLYISSVSLVGGNIHVAVRTTGSSQGPYAGDTITLTYNLWPLAGVVSNSAQADRRSTSSNRLRLRRSA